MTAEPGDPTSDRVPTGHAGSEDEDVPPPPITFWIMIVLAVLYLAWRVIQGLVWLFERVL